MIRCNRYSRKVRMAFGQMVLPFDETKAWEFPPEYGQDYICPFSINFISPRTVRVRFDARRERKREEPSVMLCCEPGQDASWKREDGENATIYRGEYGSVTLTHNPFHIEIRDSSGKLMTGTEHFGDTKSIHTADNIPFSFVRRNEDLKKFIAASFSLSPDEKIFGCGESFTRLNKRGQKVILWTTGNHGGQTPEMYKPVPFFMSSRGYGMFVHSSAPMAFDFGSSYDQYSTLFLGDDHLDLFVFLGTPREILSEYTALTCRSPVPPLWSFGLWMSRITYKSEEEIKEVGKKLREHRIPCDVINIDTGWFEKDWRCDYKFSESRFEDPAKMLGDLKNQGFRTCLWQLPYFTPTNPLYKVMLEKGFAVLDAEGDVAGEDAVIDFSNPDAVQWYTRLRKYSKLPGFHLFVPRFFATFSQFSHGFFHSIAK